jgi:hypothetical protein
MEVQVSSGCGRTLTTCEDLYNQHKAFLATIGTGNAAIMWQYFLSGASSSLGSNEAFSTPSGSGRGAPPLGSLQNSGRSPGTVPGSGTYTAGKRTRSKKGKGGSDVEGYTPNGNAITKRLTPRQTSGGLVVRIPAFLCIRAGSVHGPWQNGSALNVCIYSLAFRICWCPVQWYYLCRMT